MFLSEGIESSSEYEILSARANFSMLSKEILRAPLSTWATKVRCNPASNDNSSCDQFFSLRNRVRFAAKHSRADSFFVLFQQI